VWFRPASEKDGVMAKSLYVGGLPYSTTDEAVRTLFSEAGEVTAVRLIMDRETGQSKGFAFVEMPNDGEALMAVQQFNGYQMGGRTLTVNEARPREERGGGGGYGGGNRRY
jgi:cold-inducible RNA-binding protein